MQRAREREASYRCVLDPSSTPGQPITANTRAPSRALPQEARELVDLKQEYRTAKRLRDDAKRALIAHERQLRGQMGSSAGAARRLSSERVVSTTGGSSQTTLKLETRLAKAEQRLLKAQRRYQLSEQERRLVQGGGQARLVMKRMRVSWQSWRRSRPKPPRTGVGLPPGTPAPNRQLQSAPQLSPPLKSLLASNEGKRCKDGEVDSLASSPRVAPERA